MTRARTHAGASGKRSLFYLFARCGQGSRAADRVRALQFHDSGRIARGIDAHELGASLVALVQAQRPEAVLQLHDRLSPVQGDGRIDHRHETRAVLGSEHGSRDNGNRGSPMS